MGGGYDMEQQKLSLKRHVLVANKLLAVCSGLNRVTKTKTGYRYEKHELGITSAFTSIRWTSSLIKQVLAYMSFCDSNGRVICISEKTLAHTIGCSVRTIRNNNKLLASKGILTWERAVKEYTQVTLCRYMEDFLDLYPINKGNSNKALSTEELEAQPTEEIEGSSENFSLESILKNYRSKSGYTSISEKVMYLLFELDDINSLRVALRALYTFEKQVNLQGSTEALLSYQEIREVLPSYIGYKAAIRKIASKLKSIFEIDVLENANYIVSQFMGRKYLSPTFMSQIKDEFLVSFNLSGSHHSKLQKQIEEHEATQLVYTFENNYRKYGTFSYAIRDIYVLAHEYGVPVLKDVLQKIQENLQMGITNDNLIDLYRETKREIETHFTKYIRKIANGKRMAHFVM